MAPSEEGTALLRPEGGGQPWETMGEDQSGSVVPKLEGTLAPLGLLEQSMPTSTVSDSVPLGPKHEGLTRPNDADNTAGPEITL